MLRTLLAHAEEDQQTATLAQQGGRAFVSQHEVLGHEQGGRVQGQDLVNVVGDALEQSDEDEQAAGVSDDGGVERATPPPPAVASLPSGEVR